MPFVGFSPAYLYQDHEGPGRERTRHGHHQLRGITVPYPHQRNRRHRGQCAQPYAQLGDSRRGNARGEGSGPCGVQGTSGKRNRRRTFTVVTRLSLDRRGGGSVWRPVSQYVLDDLDSGGTSLNRMQAVYCKRSTASPNRMRRRYIAAARLSNNPIRSSRHLSCSSKHQTRTPAFVLCRVCACYSAMPGHI